MRNQVDDLIPLVQPTVPIIINDVLDLRKHDSFPNCTGCPSKRSSTIEDSAAIIECTVIEQSGFRLHRFLIFDDFRLILVEPEVSRVGFGIVRLVAAMEHVTVGVLLSIFHLLL